MQNRDDRYSDPYNRRDGRDGRDGGYGRGRGDNRDNRDNRDRDNRPQHLQKNSSTQSGRGGRGKNDRGREATTPGTPGQWSEGGKSPTKKRGPKQVITEEKQAELKRCFDKYVKQQGEQAEEEGDQATGPDFSSIQQTMISYNTKEGNPVGGLLVAKFLETVFDLKEETITAHLRTWFSKLIEGKIVSSTDLTIGISQFLTIAADLESDCPHIALLFSRQFLVPLLKDGVVTTQSIKWPAVNDEMYAFDLYFKVMAEVLYFE
jgi:hypothetical protein